MEYNTLHIDSIKKSFDNKNILQDIYLKINSGDIVGLLGRNGSGKSTLLNIIFGTLEAESKFIKINDTVYEKVYINKNVVNYLPQNDFLPKDLKVKSLINICFKKSISKNIKNDEIIKKIINTKIRNISGGELRYLEIKLLLNLESKFLLLDEPFNGVSPLLIEKIKKMIKENSLNKGIILTDHDYRNVLSVANRIHFLKDGSLIEIKNKIELKKYGYIPDEN